MTCAHHWKIEEPNGPLSTGTCKHCGMEKPMRNGFPGDVIGKGAWDAIKLETWERAPHSKTAKSPRTPREKRPLVHGTRYAYTRHRCRCETCKAWNRGYVKERYWRSKGMEPPEIDARTIRWAS